MSTNTTRIVKLLDRDQAIDGLKRIREEWEQVADIRHAETSVAFMLADCSRAIGLSHNEQVDVLGPVVMQYAEVGK